MIDNNNPSNNDLLLIKNFLSEMITVINTNSDNNIIINEIRNYINNDIQQIINNSNSLSEEIIDLLKLYLFNY